ncbi:flagellar protein FliT [Pontibacterium sp.]|uniref:flagellar protein FliT n=1 Tax=Pontibacterium sp. TaxID=2036026 RepID=UPI0035152EE0
MIDLVKKLFELTLEMKALSDNGDWETVEKLQQQRAVLLTHIQDTPFDELTETDTREAARLIKEIKRLETQCEEQATLQRNLLTQKHGKLSKGKAMQKAYGAHSNKFGR